MVSNSESKCYFIQLQIDTYLDGELGRLQRDEFQLHVQNCAACAKEFQFAQTVYDAVLDLPQLDCNDQVLEPIHRLGGGAPITAGRSNSSWWQGAQAWFTAIPAFPRYAIPALVLLLVVLPLFNAVTNQQQDAPQLVQQDFSTLDMASTEAVTQYSVEDIQKALADLNLAIEYLNDVGQRTEVLIGERFIINPLQESLDASFEVMRNRNDDPLQNDPI